VYLIYSNLLSLSRTFLQRGELPAFIGLWWAHLLLLAVIVIMLNIRTMKNWFRSRPVAAD